MHRTTYLPSGLLLAALLYPPAGAVAQGTAAPEYAYPYAHLNHVEGDVTLQRASEPEPEPGAVNVPILPGDRIWTHEGSRAEVRFEDGTVLRLDEGTKVDFVDLGAEALLRVWTGSAILKLADSRGGFRIDSPAGTVRPTKSGTYRIDVGAGESLTLSVPTGSAELSSEQGAVLVQSGETSRVAPGELPEIPYRFNTARFDELDRFSDERDRLASSRDILVRGLPPEVQTYAPDLSYHGDWIQEPGYGTVWYPSVATSWAPYRYGRWCYTRFGYTWVSHEPWGWAPYHYGRWGHSRRGWFWIPGRTWGPAWVSFGLGPFWVGWSPLGFHDRPVFVFDGFRRGKHARFKHHGGWNFVSRDHFRSRSATARLDPDLVRASTSHARWIDGRAVLDRDLTPRTARPRSLASGSRFERDRFASPRVATPRNPADDRRGMIRRAEPARSLPSAPRATVERAPSPSEPLSRDTRRFGRTRPAERVRRAAPSERVVVPSRDRGDSIRPTPRSGSGRTPFVDRSPRTGERRPSSPPSRERFTERDRRAIPTGPSAPSERTVAPRGRGDSIRPTPRSGSERAPVVDRSSRTGGRRPSSPPSRERFTDRGTRTASPRGSAASRPERSGQRMGSRSPVQRTPPASRMGVPSRGERPPRATAPSRGGSSRQMGRSPSAGPRSGEGVRSAPRGNRAGAAGANTRTAAPRGSRSKPNKK